MRRNCSQSGSVLLIVVVLVALLAATVMGHLQVNAEEMQLMQNHLHGAEATTIAEAGLNDAFAHLRLNPGWAGGPAAKTFRGGSYRVTRDAATITSVATTSDGFTARMEAEVTIASDGPPHVIRIDELRINP
jgi:hypothetical protein